MVHKGVQGVLLKKTLGKNISHKNKRLKSKNNSKMGEDKGKVSTAPSVSATAPEKKAKDKRTTNLNRYVSISSIHNNFSVTS